MVEDIACHDEVEMILKDAPELRNVNPDCHASTSCSTAEQRTSEGTVSFSCTPFCTSFDS